MPPFTSTVPDVNDVELVPNADELVENEELVP